MGKRNGNQTTNQLVKCFVISCDFRAFVTCSTHVHGLPRVLSHLACFTDERHTHPIFRQVQQERVSHLSRSCKVLLSLNSSKVCHNTGYVAEPMVELK